MHIGVDFDNTIVCYDDVFQRVAVDRGLVPPSFATSKTGLRHFLCAAGRENDWTEIQGEVYGNRMAEVTAYPGADLPGRLAAQRGPGHDRQPQDALCPARAALRSSPGRPRLAGTARRLRSRAHRAGAGSGVFRIDRGEKLQRIAAVQCTHFIDDLPDLLAEPDFPAGGPPLSFRSAPGPRQRSPLAARRLVGGAAAHPGR